MGRTAGGLAPDPAGFRRPRGTGDRAGSDRQPGCSGPCLHAQPDGISRCGDDLGSRRRLRDGHGRRPVRLPLHAADEGDLGGLPHGARAPLAGRGAGHLRGDRVGGGQRGPAGRRSGENHPRRPQRRRRRRGGRGGRRRRCSGRRCRGRRCLLLRGRGWRAIHPSHAEARHQVIKGIGRRGRRRRRAAHQDSRRLAARARSSLHHAPRPEHRVETGSP